MKQLKCHEWRQWNYGYDTTDAEAVHVSVFSSSVLCEQHK